MTERAKVAKRTVKDVMIREVVSIDSSTNLLEAAKQMRDRTVTSVCFPSCRMERCEAS